MPVHHWVVPLVWLFSMPLKKKNYATVRWRSVSAWLIT
jgi:hypothetical protein